MSTGVTVPLMYEFDSVSVSSYEASSLATKLSEKSGDGWEVVAIVPAGSDITAFLKREASGASDTASAPAEEPAVSEPAGWGTAPASTGHRSVGLGCDDVDVHRCRHRRLALIDTGRQHAGQHSGVLRAQHTIGAGRLVRRPRRSLRAALLGRVRLDRARLPRRPAVHRPARRLTIRVFAAIRVCDVRRPHA